MVHRLPLCTVPTAAVVVLAGFGCASAPATVPLMPATNATPATGAPPGAVSTAATRAAFVSPYSYASYLRGDVLAARGDFEAATEAYRAALSESDDDPWVIHHLAMTLHAAGHTQEAMTVIADGLAEQPGAGPLWLARAELAQAAGQWQPAIEAYERAMTVANDDGEAALRLAELLQHAGKRRRAIAVLEQAAQAGGVLETGAARARLALAVDTGDAVQIERAMAALFPLWEPRRHELLSLANRLAAHDRPRLATELLERLPPDAENAPVRVRLLLQTGQLAQARRVLAETPPAWIGGPGPAAAAWLSAGRPARAIELAGIATATGTADERTVALITMAKAHLALGDAAAAARLMSDIPAGTSYETQVREIVREAFAQAGRTQLATEIIDLRGH